MGYRIKYGELRIVCRKKNTILAVQTVCAVILLCFVLLGAGISEKYGGALRQVFQSKETGTFAFEYAQGKPFRQIFVNQCRQILIEAGYHG